VIAVLKWPGRGAEGERMTKTCTRLIVVPVLVSGFLGGWSATARAEGSAEQGLAMAPPEAPAEAPVTPHGDGLPAAEAQVARAVFARAIVEREPQNVASSLDADTSQIFFFTELLGMEGRTVRHRWALDSQVMADVPFQVGGPRWRVYSSKLLLPDQPGSWTVSVVDESGSVLRSEALGPALATPEAPSPTPPAAPQP
jgi:hypothetical protein